MSVVIDFEEAGPWRKRLTIEVPAPAVDAETGRVVKDLGRSIHLPGFRKGKVPASLILKRFPEEVERRVAERLVPRYLHQAEAEKNLEPLTQPRVEDLKFEPGSAMTFVALVETRPEIELKNIDDFTLPEGDVEPSEDEVADALADLRRSHATWAAVERPAATGDLVHGQVSDLGTEDAEPKPLRIEIGAEGVDEELSLALTGLAPGQSTSFRRALEPDKGERDYRLEVTSVEEQELPELDDELAASLGDFENVTALTEAVTMRLGAAKENNLRQQRERALLEQLRDRHPLELPSGLVDKEVNEMLQEQASHLASQGVDLETASINWEAMAEQIRPHAGKRVHDRLLLDAVAKQKDVKLDEAEFERMLGGIAQQQGKSSLAVRQELSAAGRLGDLRAQLLEQQTLRQLIGGGEEGAAEAEDAAEAEEASSE